MGATGLLTLDARSPARFAGEEPEPRPGVRPGHIPGSRNLHYAQVVADGGQGLKSEAELKRLFADVGTDQVDTVITTCGSGISACILALALHEIGRSPISVYDGSWAEWGADLSCQVEKG
jgi:thiosulfate/3-mercaptopyruvate sulfurtransferase